MTDVLIHAAVIAGSGFVLLAAIGVVRMPDLYMRMSTVTKAGTMGVGLLLLAVVLQVPGLTIVIKGVAVLLFGFLTSPVTAHMVSRAAYFQGVELWEGTLVDELRGQYETWRHELASPGWTEEVEQSAEPDAQSQPR